MHKKYRPAYLNRQYTHTHTHTHIIIINFVNTVLRPTKVTITITEPPIQYIRWVRQCTDTQNHK